MGVGGAGELLCRGEIHGLERCWEGFLDQTQNPFSSGGLEECSDGGVEEGREEEMQRWSL